MNYDKHNAKPFCPNFYNCKRYNDKEHNREFMHPCVKGASCDDIKDKKHTQCWYHFRLPTCPYGSTCPQIGNPSHRASYHHETKEKGGHAIRDYMLPCDYHSRCIINDKVHSMTFQHNLPFVFPEDDIAPKYELKICQRCLKLCSGCTCEAGRVARPERSLDPSPPSTQSRDKMMVRSNSTSRSSSSSFSLNSVISSFNQSPPSTQSRNRIITPNSTQNSMSVPRFSVSPISSVTLFAKSKSVIDFCCGKRTLKWGYDFKTPPSQLPRGWRSEEYIFDDLLTPGINEI